jgi:hemolysin activation/secretion protein
MRIGGLRTIRGINEESIFATAWAVSTIEYRLLPEENSAVYLFVDMAWYEYDGSRGYIRDTPLSAGAGFNFETKAGIFTFNYALGKQFDNPVLLRNGKISFGFRSLF